MASRPVFTPWDENDHALVKEILIEFTWNPGMAASQKQKNVRALHHAASQKGLGPTLEVSSKSPTAVGVELSAFNLMLETEGVGRVTVEAAFQGSKVFTDGGPYPDMYRLAGRDLKRDQRLTQSGQLVAFEWNGEPWPLEPRTAFYDWLYIGALRQRDHSEADLAEYQSFTDIEFNPAKSINCQARSCALFVSLLRRNVDGVMTRSQADFIGLAYPGSGHPEEGRQDRFPI